MQMEDVLEIAIPIPKHPSLALLFISFLRLGMKSFDGPAMTAYIHRMAVKL